MSILDSLASKLRLEDVTSEYRKSYDRGYEAWIPCAEVEAVNYTPWWGGDYRTYVRDPKTLRVTSLPTSDTIKGAIRWVLRAALNAHLDTDIKTLDEILAEVYGGTRKTGEHEEHLDSLVRIRVAEANVDTNCDQQIVQPTVQLARQTYAIRDRKQRDRFLVANVFTLIGKKLDKREAYKKILTVARFELTTMGKSVDEIIAVLPVPPGCLRLRVAIDVSRRLKQPDPSLICKLTLLALLYALTVRGIGRGSTRGFGRFCVDGIECRQCGDVQEITSLAKSLLDSDKIEDALCKIHEQLVQLAAKLAPIVKHKACGGCAPSLRPINSLQHAPGVIVRVVRNARHPAPKPVSFLKQAHKVRIADIYDALSAIGRAFMKNTWKKYSEVVRGNIQSPGIGFHTWIAGLPRWQQSTGYALIDPDALAGLVKGACRSNVCVDKGTLNKPGVKPEPGRRISSIIAYPLPEQHASTIVLVAYVTINDHEGVLRGKVVEGRRRRLYHVGRHGPLKNPCRHVVELASTAGNASVPAPSAQCSVNNCERRCGSDSPAGVVYPSRLPGTARDARDLIVQAYESALEHILNVLR